MNTYDRLARVLRYLDRAEGRTAQDQNDILFARQQIESVLGEMRASEATPTPLGADQ